MSFELGVAKKDIQGKNVLKTIRILSESELAQFEKASSNLLRFSENERLYKLTLLNYQEFLESIIGYSAKYKKEPANVTFEFLDEISLNINRTLLNYLFSVRAFLDHTEAKLKKIYGANSSNYLNFYKICSEEYDKNFSYRFLYRLRNYSQHCGLPIEQIYLESEEKPVFSGLIKSRLIVKFKKSTLLRYNGWGPLKQEIDKLPDEIEVVSVVSSFWRSLDKVNNVLIEDNKTELFDSAEYIQHLISQIKSDEGSPVIFRIIDYGKTKNILFLNIPLHLLEYSKRLKEYSKKFSDGKT
jgi:hypothetical protein